MTTVTTLIIPDDLWRPDSDYLGIGDPYARLRADITINGTPMYLEAYAVRQNPPHDEFELLDPAVNDMLDDLVGDAAYPLATILVAGREYLVLGIPGSR